MVVLASHSTLGILTNPLLKKVRLALQRNKRHPRERVFDSVELRLFQLDEQLVRDEHDVLAHRLLIDASERLGQGLRNVELLFDLDRFDDHVLDLTSRGRLDQELVEEAGKVAVQYFVTADQLIREGQSCHHTTRVAYLSQ